MGNLVPWGDAESLGQVVGGGYVLGLAVDADGSI